MALHGFYRSKPREQRRWKPFFYRNCYELTNQGRRWAETSFGLAPSLVWEGLLGVFQNNRLREPPEMDRGHKSPYFSYRSLKKGDRVVESLGRANVRPGTARRHRATAKQT